MPGSNNDGVIHIPLNQGTKQLGSFPNDEAMLKLLSLALNNIARKWTVPIRDWKAALNRFSILFGDRMPAY
jgi:putative transposase